MALCTGKPKFRMGLNNPSFVTLSSLLHSLQCSFTVCVSWLFGICNLKSLFFLARFWSCQKTVDCQLQQVCSSFSSFICPSFSCFICPSVYVHSTILSPLAIFLYNFLYGILIKMRRTYWNFVKNYNIGHCNWAPKYVYHSIVLSSFWNEKIYK